MIQQACVMVYRRREIKERQQQYPRCLATDFFQLFLPTEKKSNRLYIYMHSSWRISFILAEWFCHTSLWLSHGDTAGKWTRLRRRCTRHTHFSLLLHKTHCYYRTGSLNNNSSAIIFRIPAQSFLCVYSTQSYPQTSTIAMTKKLPNIW